MSTTRLHCLFYNYNASLIIAPIVHWWLENWVHNWGTSQNLNTTAWDTRQNVSRDLQKSTNVTLKVCGSYIKKNPFLHSPMTCHPWERKPNWASAVWPKLSHQYQSLSNCGSWGNMWEEGKHLPCHYSRLSQFTPTPNLQLPLPSFHPSTSVCCTTVNGRGG